MNRVDAAPGMMPWVRETERRLGALENVGSGETSTPTTLTRMSSIPESLVAPTGAGDWGVLIDNMVVRASTNTGLLKIILSAHTEAATTGAGPFAAIGSMIVMAEERIDYSNLDAISRTGLVASFNAVVSQTVGLRSSGSLTRVLQLPIGSYTLRTAYLYRNLTANVQLIWSNRAIIAEQI